MKYSFVVALSTLVLGITAAPAAANGNALAHAERGFFDFLHNAARAEEQPSKTKSAKGPKKIKPSKVRKPSPIITSHPFYPIPGNATRFSDRRVVNSTAPAPGGGLPASSGTTVLKAAQTVAAGESFDGKMFTFDRGVSCTGQAEGGDKDAVFILEKGAKLSNVIIGPNQIEGVHCMGGCTLTNVWWSAVCEDAFTIKKQDAGETTTITSGGAFGAEDKVLQHNGAGTLSVTGFTVDTFGKLYRSCGNCKAMFERHVVLDNIKASSGKLLAGINSNYGDTATFTNIVAKGVKQVCTEFEGNDNGAEPTKLSSGPSNYCKYATSDITSA